MTAGDTRPKSRSQSGFTMLEMLVAMMILLLGTVGILSMHQSSMRSTSHSRHATEASVLGEDKLEDLRLTPVTALANGSDAVNAQALDAGVGFTYTRVWTVVFVDTVAKLQVVVSWQENGEPHSLTFTTQRHQ